LNTPDKEELVKRARFLRNAAPQQFNEFFAAFVDYADGKYEGLVRAEASNFLQLQGQAQQCQALLQLLEGVKNG
jgi:hypothetical protein